MMSKYLQSLDPVHEAAQISILKKINKRYGDIRFHHFVANSWKKGLLKQVKGAITSKD